MASSVSYFLPSDRSVHRKPKSREVTSRYLATPSATSFSHRSGARTAPNTPIPVHSVSEDRPRPEMTNAEKLVAGNGSKRSLCGSLQGEDLPNLNKAVGVPIGKTKQAPTPVAERRRDENSRPREDKRWPGRSQDGADFTKSLDCGTTVEKSKKKVGALQFQQSVDESSLSSISGSTAAPDLASSDSESVTSRRPRAIAVPARFWQETTNRLRKLPEPHPMKKSLSDSNPTSSPPSKIPSTLSPSRRGKLSPSRVRSRVRNMLNESVSNTPSILSFAADARQGKVGENKNADMHELRMLHNRYLQWRFADARAASAMKVQRDMAEKSLYSVWESTFDLRNSVKSKRVELQQLRHHLKLYSLLKVQMPYLDDWELFDGDYSSSLEGAVESLVSSTLRLPLVGGAKANIQEFEDTISSAVDLMHRIGSSLCAFLDKVVQTNSLASELASISSKERVSLDQCRDHLSTLTAMQVEDCSLRTQMLQLAHINPCGSTQSD